MQDEHKRSIAKEKVEFARATRKVLPFRYSSLRSTNLTECMHCVVHSGS